MDRSDASVETMKTDVELYAVVSSNRRFQFVSSNSIEVLGYSNNDLIGGNIENYIHTEDMFFIESYFLNEHHPHQCKFRFLHKDGRYIWFEASIDFIRNSLRKHEQEIILKIKYLHDSKIINAYPQSYRLVNRSYTVQEGILKDLPNPLFISNKGQIHYVNQPFLDLIGAASDEQVIGRHVIDFVEDSYQDLAKERIERLRNGEQVGTTQQKWIRLDSTEIYVEVAANLTSYNGKVAEVVLVSEISSRKNFQKILRKSRERYQRLIDNSIDTIAVIHRDRWVFVNESGVKLFEAGEYPNMLGKSIYDHLHPDDHHQMKQSLGSILSGETEVQITKQSWSISDNKTIYTEMVCIPTTYFGEKAVQVILRDISDRKKAEELMLRSEKLSIAGQLAAGIAHEIRNPLTAIKGFLQIMQPDLKNNHTQYFNIIFSELNRIEIILSELLMLAKPQETKFKVTNVVSLLQDVAMLLETQANLNSVYIEQRHENTKLFIHCDQNQLKQVFINLFKNAIDAMPKGGKLTVHTKSVKNKVRIIVKDEGEGIPEELMKRIGEPFLTTKEKGNGLGLMITYKIIEDHNGTIFVDSQLGKGSTFTVEIPYEASIIEEKSLK